MPDIDIESTAPSELPPPTPSIPPEPQTWCEWWLWWLGLWP